MKNNKEKLFKKTCRIVVNYLHYNDTTLHDLLRACVYFISFSTCLLLYCTFTMGNCYCTYRMCLIVP